MNSATPQFRTANLCPAGKEAKQMWREMEERGQLRQTDFVKPLGGGPSQVTFTDPQ